MDFIKKMGNFSKKLEKTATDTYNVVADKSEKIVEETKTRITITRVRRRYFHNLR